MNTDRAETASLLKQSASQVCSLQAFVGLDGFVDEIFHVVDKRQSTTSYTRLRTMSEFAERMAQAAGKSTNIELVSQLVKLGGNGPILANALASLGTQVTYLGNLGYPNLHPVFSEFAQRAKVHSIAEPGLTDALEFEDGKVMVGKHQSLKEVNWDNIVGRVGQDHIVASLNAAQLICFVNWTMLTAMSDIWEAIQKEVSAKLPGKRRLLFIDLADPEKRMARDIQHGLKLIRNFQQQFDVILGLNEKESGEVAEVLDVDIADASSQGLAQRAAQLREQLGIDTVVIHPVRCAVSADQNGTASVEGPFTARPRITTGAGDHFNAGFCLGRLLGMSNQHSLWTGVTTSGFYVRNAQSPSIQDVINMLGNWPQPETDRDHQ